MQVLNCQNRITTYLKYSTISDEERYELGLPQRCIPEARTARTASTAIHPVHPISLQYVRSYVYGWLQNKSASQHLLK